MVPCVCLLSTSEDHFVEQLDTCEGLMAKVRLNLSAVFL